MVLEVSPCSRSLRSRRSSSLSLKSITTSRSGLPAEPASPDFQTKLSAPLPPVRVSLPLPPVRMSSPTPPSRLLAPLPPPRAESLDPAWMVSSESKVICSDWVAVLS
ncbi:hypothetical protein D9M70_516770 [compost metagenome]